MEWLRKLLKSREADVNRSKGMRSLNGFSDNKGIAELGHTTSQTTVLVQGVWYEVLYDAQNHELTMSNRESR